MTPGDLRNIHTTGNNNRGALPCVNMILRLPAIFSLLMEKPLGRSWSSSSPYYQAAHCNQKTPIPASSRWQVRSEKAKKRISIDTNHSYHQHWYPWASLNWSNSKIRFSFNQPNRKDGVRGCWFGIVGFIQNLSHDF